MTLKSGKADAARSSEGLDPGWHSSLSLYFVLPLYYILSHRASQDSKDGTTQSHEFWEVWFIGDHLWRLATIGNTIDKKIIPREHQ